MLSGKLGPRLLLRAEGAAVAVLALVLYRELGQPWWVFAVFFLAPDLSLLGYLGGPRLGAVAYNLVHTYALPVLGYAFGFALAHPGLMAAGLIWAAHIGVDRVLGFGLKYATGFRDTHLNKV